MQFKVVNTKKKSKKKEEKKEEDEQPHVFLLKTNHIYGVFIQVLVELHAKSEDQLFNLRWNNTSRYIWYFLQYLFRALSWKWLKLWNEFH